MTNNALTKTTSRPSSIGHGILHNPATCAHNYRRRNVKRRYNCHILNLYNNVTVDGYFRATITPGWLFANWRKCIVQLRIWSPCNLVFTRLSIATPTNQTLHVHSEIISFKLIIPNIHTFMGFNHKAVYSVKTTTLNHTQNQFVNPCNLLPTCQ